MRSTILALGLWLAVGAPARLRAQASPLGPAQTPRPDPPPIADNSFLLEEAYNQEPGVVQHISAFQRSLQTRAWGYSFTQEWPVVVQRHQLSYTLPVQRVAGRGAPSGIGDLAINYRYQALGGEGTVAAAPRLSFVVPTGNEAKGLGSGGAGIQVNLPVSVVVARRLVTHWNAGFTRVPNAKNVLGYEAATTAYNAGASAIWHVRPTFNVLLEVAWARDQEVSGPDQTVTGEALVVNPGIRWAHNFRNGLQIVPGVAVPIGIGPSRGETAAFLYLSFEHSFKRGSPPP